MTTKTMKISEIIEESESIKCPAKRTLYVAEKFLAGPMCGRCYPCAFGSYEAKLRLRDITEGNASADDLEALKLIGGKMLTLSMCKKGKDLAAFILDTLTYPAFGDHLRGICKEMECTALIEYRNVPENCIRCGLCLEACRSDAIIGEKQITERCCYLPFEIRQRRCTKCGECIKVCPTKSIIVVNIEEEAGVKA